ncbi:MAG: EamA family transporter [Candidatus Sericytochromatia bacterium]|nr:EamA family transporter [Candidatus Sericytochromatia bacterium]
MLKSLVLLLIGVLLGIVGQLSLKSGMKVVASVGGGAVPMLMHAALNLNVIIGIACYGFSMIFWLLVISKLDLSLAYPMLGISYIGVVFASWWWLGEAISPMRWAGTLVICLGVYLVARS